MAALCSRCGHYIFALWFLLSIFFFFSVKLQLTNSSFFPHLISAVADWMSWMSVVLAHMVWSYCKFRMQVWNMLHAARWKIQDSKKSPKIRHLHTIAQLCPAISSQLRHLSTFDNQKKFVKQQYLLHMSSQYGELWPTNACDWFVSFGDPI